VKGVHVTETLLRAEGLVTKLVVQLGRVQVKIEVTPVLRGTVFPADMRRVTQTVEDQLGFAEIQVVSFADLYAGKIVAALDRQHPRDLFDVRDLLATEVVSEALRQAFVAYIISHGRPMAEVLAPTRKDVTQAFESEFQGMTAEPVSLEELTVVRETLIQTIVGQMPDDHRNFLVSFECGEPDWSLLGIPGIDQLPAVQWRQQNLDSLSAEKRLALVISLAEVLGVDHAPA
jgi:hypothetical protein